MADDDLDRLIRETEDLDERARSVQGERELLFSPQQINALISDYQDWYARALMVLPEEFHEKFTDLYAGGLVIKRIKSFLEAPGSVSVLFNPDQPGPFSFWEHPYESTFHSSLLEQRQLLTQAKQTLAVERSAHELELVVRVGRGLPGLVNALRSRYDRRPGFEVNDEYDVQDLLGGVLRMIFGDVRPEDPAPTQAGGSSRVDFVLKAQRIAVEVKMTRKGLNDRALGNQLIEDIERYRSHPECNALVAVVYDPDRHISNPAGLENDLGRDHDGLAVRVVIAS
jgi:hypothetical protein